MPAIPDTLNDVLDGDSRLALLPAERSKLAGVSAGATANATDAQLRDRSTHTGSQASSTITGLDGSIANLLAAQSAEYNARVAADNARLPLAGGTMTGATVRAAGVLDRIGSDNQFGASGGVTYYYVGTSGLKVNNQANTLTVLELTNAGNATFAGTLTASTLVGDGAGITGPIARTDQGNTFDGQITATGFYTPVSPDDGSYTGLGADGLEVGGLNADSARPINSYASSFNVRGNTINANDGSGTGGGTWSLDGGTLANVGSVAGNLVVNGQVRTFDNSALGLLAEASTAYAVLRLKTNVRTWQFATGGSSSPGKYNGNFYFYNEGSGKTPLLLNGSTNHVYLGGDISDEAGSGAALILRSTGATEATGALTVGGTAKFGTVNTSTTPGTRDNEFAISSVDGRAYRWNQTARNGDAALTWKLLG